MPAVAGTATNQARWVDRHAGLLVRSVGEDVARQLARLTADTIAIAHYARAGCTGATAVDATGLASGEVGVWGSSRRHSALDAAFLNGSAAEALDFQEVLIDGRNNGHAAVVIVPALLALAEVKDIAGDTLCRGLWIAFAANISLARTLGRGHRAGTPGFRTTSLTAPVAAALGGALMLTGDARIASHAVGIAAASLPAGLLAAMSPQAGDFSVDKDLSVGFSARHAAHAVLLAEAGATGPAEVLTGPRGWVASYGYNTDESHHLQSDPFDADLSAYALKLFPANFGCQCAIRLAMDLAQETPPEDVVRLTTRVKSSSAASLSTRNLRTHVAARFSLPYAVSSAFVRRRSILIDFESDAVEDPAVRAFMEKVEIVGDEALEARHHDEGIFPARLSLQRRDGSVAERSLDRLQDGLTVEQADAMLTQKIECLCPPNLAATLLWICANAGDAAAFGRFLNPDAPARRPG